jgi:hypothetical protein
MFSKTFTQEMGSYLRYIAYSPIVDEPFSENSRESPSA